MRRWIVLPMLLAAACAGPHRRATRPIAATPTFAEISPYFFPETLPSSPIGVIEGNSEITASGEYRYTIPIQVPRGRAGIEPSLSLQYASRSGDGRLGMGWNLVGLPEIRRCASTIATEGFTEGVSYEEQDRFCLDNQKLVLISGAHGRDGAEYRTEEDSFSRIIARRFPSEQEPSSFRVWTKDGRILDFGGSRGARIMVGRTAATGSKGVLVGEGLRTVAWTLAEMRDRAGNRMTVNHRDSVEVNIGDGVEYEPEFIGYVRQGEDDPSRGRTVEFDYEGRPDRSFEYVGGVRFNRTKRLRRIRTLVGTQRVGEYRLEYIQSAKTGRSLLSRIRRCDALGVCLSAKVLNWDVDVGVAVPFTVADAPQADVARLQAPAAFANRLIVGDLDGDGRDDVVYEVPSGTQFKNDLRVRFSVIEGRVFQAPAFGNAIAPAAPKANWDLFASRAIDTDNDGRTEVLAFGVAPSGLGLGYQLHRLTGNQFIRVGPFFLSRSTSDGASDGMLDFGDTNGDGLFDIFAAKLANNPAGLTQISYFRNQGANNFGPLQDLGRWCGGLGATGPRILDVTGDGRAEWLVNVCPVPADGGLRAMGFAPNNALLVERARANLFVPGSTSEFVLADLNGDGLKDAVSLRAEGEAGQPLHLLRVRWNTGRGFGPAQLLEADGAFAIEFDHENPPFDSGLRVADMDGDGREDLLKFSSGVRDGSRGLRMFLSRGTHFVTRDIQRDPGRADGTFGWVGSQLGDFDGDGMTDIVQITNQEPGRLRVLLNINLRPDLLMEIEDERIDPDQRRASEIVGYSQTWGEEQHTLPIICNYPQRCLKRGIPVVRLHGTWNGFAYSLVDYSYENARLDLLGRGFLGFGVQRIIDRDRHTDTTLRFNHDMRVGTRYPLAGRPTARIETLSGTGFTRTTTALFTYEVRPLNNGASYAVFPIKTTNEVSEAAVPTSRTLRHDIVTQEWDDFGNETFREHSTCQGAYARTRTTMYEGASFVQAWLISLPEEVRTTSGQDTRCSFSPDVRPNSLRPERTAHFTWNSLGQLTDLTVEPAINPFKMNAHYDYDSGLVARVTMTDDSGNSRAVQIDYDSDKVHPQRLTNALGHATVLTMHSVLDVPGEVVDPNGVRTRMAYDGFSRLRSKWSDDGSGFGVTYSASTSGQGDVAVTVAPKGGAATTTDFYLGRAVHRSVQAFDGRTAEIDLQYDHLGRLVLQTRPGFDFTRFSTATRYVYDELDRLTKVTAPDGATTLYQYDGLKTRTVDPASHAVDVVTDPNGRAVLRSETLAGLGPRSVQYVYGDFGVVEKILPSASSATEFTYDLLGRRTRIVDPDAGHRTYVYNAFGEVIEERDGDGETTVYLRDLLGRITVRRDSRGKDLFDWDGGPFAVGKMVRTTSADGVRTRQEYDATGRANRTTTDADNRSYVTERTFDAVGRLATLTYPMQDASFGLVFSYTATGFLKAIHSLDGKLWLEVEARAADGQLARSRLGNGLIEEDTYRASTGQLESRRVLRGTTAVFDRSYGYDLRGLVTTRKESVRNIQDAFSYDEAERLVGHQRVISGGPPQSTGYAYDVLGNLLGVSTNGSPALTNTFGNEGRPHALATTTDPAGVVVFKYDGNGRQRQMGVARGGRVQAGRRISYTSFDLPTRVEGGGLPTVSFGYNAFGRRVVKKAPSLTTVSIEDLYESRVEPGLFSRRLNQVVYIPGEDGVTAQLYLNGRTGRPRIDYFHTDGLGSVSLATDEQGNVEEFFDFEAFGERSSTGRRLEPLLRKGFTGHIHDEDLGLINMNGRVYDPKQRRFLTPDPVLVHAQGDYALRATMTASDPMAWIGSDFNPVVPPSFASGLPVAGLLGRVMASADPQGSPGGVTSGGSDRAGYQPTSVALASSPSRIGSLSRRPGAAAAAAVVGPNLSPTGGEGTPDAPAHGHPSSFEAHNPYSYTYNNPVNYTDPSGYCPVCVYVAAAGGVLIAGGLLESDNRGAKPLTQGEKNSAALGGAMVLGAMALQYYAPAIVARYPWLMPFLTGAGAKASEGVWDSMKATQPVWPGTVVPRSFELTAGNTRVWVHGNATEHIAEWATGMSNRGVSQELVKIGTQAQLSSLQAAVQAATARGITYNQMMNVGGWELIFSPPRAAGQLPALIHAMPPR